MFDLSTLISYLIESLGPLLWGIAAYALVRLLFSQLRRRRVIQGMPIVGQLLPLVVGVLVGLERAGLLVLEHSGVALVLTATVVLTMVTVLHIGDRLLVRRMDTEGRLDAFPRLMRDIVRGLLTVLTLLVSINQFFHVQIGTLLLSSTVFTAVLGLALQDLLKNVFAGIALQLERPFAPGDWIFIDSHLGYGRVLEMSWRAIRTRTRDGHLVIVPNSVLAQQQIVNLTGLSMPIAMRLKVAVDAIHPPNIVYDLMKKAVLSIDGVLASPAPFIYARDYTSAAAIYEIKFWVANYDRYPEQQGDALKRIWYTLRRAEIKFAPNELVLTRPVDANTRRSLHYTPQQIISRLRRINLLTMLSDDELATLAEQVEIRLFSAGEVLAHQGHPETQLFAITRGRVQVEFIDADGNAVTLTELGPGEIFGERGLLMNEPRSANVVALEDTNTIMIDRENIAPFFAGNPELPERLAEILAERQFATSATLQQHQRTSAAQPSAIPSERSLAQRIRSLFDL